MKITTFLIIAVVVIITVVVIYKYLTRKVKIVQKVDQQVDKVLNKLDSYMKGKDDIPHNKKSLSGDASPNNKSLSGDDTSNKKSLSGDASPNNKSLSSNNPLYGLMSHIINTYEETKNRPKYYENSRKSFPKKERILDFDDYPESSEPHQRKDPNSPGEIFLKTISGNEVREESTTKDNDIITPAAAASQKYYKFSSSFIHSSGKSITFTPFTVTDKGAIKNLGEHLCRIEVEKFFMKHFPTIKSKGFISSPVTDRALEIDCYNDEFRIGLEFNGAQHYDFPNRYHADRKAFETYIWNDKCKRQQCENMKILLIEVDQRGYTSKDGYWPIIKSLRSFLNGEFGEKGDINVYISASPQRYSDILKYKA